MGNYSDALEHYKNGDHRKALGVFKNVAEGDVKFQHAKKAIARLERSLGDKPMSSPKKKTSKEISDIKAKRSADYDKYQEKATESNEKKRAKKQKVLEQIKKSTYFGEA